MLVIGTGTQIFLLLPFLLPSSLIGCCLSRALDWKVHPPTAFCFGKHLLVLLPQSSVKVNDRHAILELARFLTELSVIDYFFVIHKPSVVSLAALLNAMEDIPGARAALPTFCNEIVKATSLVVSSEDVTECRNRLRLLYAQGGYASPAGPQDNRNESISPVCVSYGAQVNHQHYDPYSERF